MFSCRSLGFEVSGASAGTAGGVGVVLWVGAARLSGLT